MRIVLIEKASKAKQSKAKQEYGVSYFVPHKGRNTRLSHRLDCAIPVLIERRSSMLFLRGSVEWILFVDLDFDFDFFDFFINT